jgi:proteasome lid subunit RPN8/RPN11
VANFARLVVPAGLLERVVAHARAELPDECCGLLAGVIADGVGTAAEWLPITNALASPAEYETDARDLLAAFRRMREAGLELLAVYHSHPTSDPVPSRRDVDRNTYGEAVVHVIVGLRGEPAVQAWWLNEDGYRPAEWEMSPSEPGRERGSGVDPRSRPGSDGGSGGGGPDYNAGTSRTPPAGPRT